MAVSEQDWLEAQHGVLGSALISPELVPKILAETSEQDYTGASRAVYLAMRTLYTSGKPVDIISVRDKLGDGQYTKYLMDLMAITPTAAHIQTYIDLCRKQAQFHRVRTLGQAIADAAEPELQQKLIEDMIAARSARTRIRCVSAHQALLDFVSSQSDNRPTDFLTWPISELNSSLYVEKGDFVLVGGRPSAGKTALSLQVAWHLAQRYKVGFFSLETSVKKLTARQISAVAGIPLESIKRNALNAQHWDSIIGLDSAFRDRRLDIIAQADIKMSELEAVVKLRGYDVIFLDYVQLLKMPGQNRTEEVTAVSMALHRLAQSAGVCVFGLVQLNRGTGESKGKAPDMASIRESGQLEQDADAVLLLYLSDEENPNSDRILRCVKNKEGERFNLRLAFDGAHQTFAKAKDFGRLSREMSRISREQRDQERLNRMNQMTILPPDTEIPTEFLKES